MTDALPPLTSAELADLKAKAKAVPYANSLIGPEIYLCLIATIEQQREQIEKLQRKPQTIEEAQRKIGYLRIWIEQRVCGDSHEAATLQALAAKEPHDE